MNEPKFKYLIPFFAGHFEVYTTSNGEKYAYLNKPIPEDNEWFKFDSETKSYQSLNSKDENNQKLKELLNQYRKPFGFC